MRSGEEQFWAIVKGKELKFVRRHKGVAFTCPCGSVGRVGMVFCDQFGEELIIGPQCTKKHLPGLVPKGKRGQRVKFSEAFRNSWGVKDE